MRVQTEPLELAGLVRSTCQRLGARRAERDLTCTLQLPEEIWVNADAAMSARLLAILFDNAIEHAPAGSQVEVCLHAAPTCLVITNAAPALTGPMLPQLGRRFFRADPVQADDRRRAAHAGLGLALARALAAAQGLRLVFGLADGRLSVRVECWPPLDTDEA